MKTKLLILILCIAFAKTASAQKDSLALDQHGKYIYYRLINNSKANAADLYSRALNFTKTAYNNKILKLTGQDAQATTLDGAGYFVVSKASSLSKHEDGKIEYKLHIEIKDQKYRYWLTGFVFTPYYKDRYDNMVPQPGIEIPIEDITKKVANNDASHYLDECGIFSRVVGAKLKSYMDADPTIKKDNTKKVITIDKW